MASFDASLHDAHEHADAFRNSAFRNDRKIPWSAPQFHSPNLFHMAAL